MKLKYYMRGMGVGIFVTSLIFLIAIAFLKPLDTTDAAAKDEQTVAEQQDSQMDDSEETTASKEDSKKSTEKETAVDADGNEMTVEKIPGATEEDEAAALAVAEEDGSAESATSDDAVEEEAAEETPQATGEHFEITISGGDGSNRVGEKLYQVGAVDSAQRFNSYLENNNYDNIIQPGTYSVPKGATYEEIANIITKRQ